MITDLLDQIDRLDQQATKGPWEEIGRTIESNGTYEDVITTEVDCASYCYGGTGGGVLKDKDAEFIALARTALPQLAKALRDIMEIHKPFHADHDYNGMDGESLHRFVLRCDGCEESGGIEDYPCPTVQAIADAFREPK